MDPVSTVAIGGTTISAGIADAQAQLSQALGGTAGFGTDQFQQFAAAYRASSGGPLLTLLGFNPFALIANGAFHQMYWAAVVLFLGVMTLVAMQHVLAGRYTVRGRHPLAGLAQVYFRLLVGVLLISNIPLLYGALMTVNGVLSQGVQAMASQAAAALFQTGGIGTLTLAQARMESIRDASTRRAIALYPSAASRAEMIAVGQWYDAMAASLNASLSAHQLPGQLPLLDPSIWTTAQRPDDQVIADIGRAVVQNFGQMIADLGALPAGSGPLAIGFPEGSTSSLSLLSDALAADDATVGLALALPNIPASNAAFEAARQLYLKNVLTHTLAYLDTQLLAVIGASPSLAQRSRSWFAETVEQAAAAAGGFLAPWRAAVDWVARSLGVMLTRIVAFFFTAATGVMIEVELFMIVLTVPLWLLPATEGAFHGILRSLVSLSLAVPAYQFIMLFVDALMSLVLKYLLFGPAATGSASMAAAAGGAAYVAAAALAAVGSGGEIVVLAMVCYLVAYIFLAIYVAWRTPKLVAAWVKGAGAAGQFISAFATGLISGAASAFATAAVAAGGSGFAGGVLGASGASGIARGPAAHYAAASTANRAPVAGAGGRPALGAVTARSAATPTAPPPTAPPSAPPRPPSERAAGSPWRETAGFGLRTFIDCLQADSPGEGAAIAFKALENHRKQQEKESEARHKLDQAAAKAAAKPAARAKKTR
jgi:hypothetical protein